ncbi:MAG TPA: Gmad2 immunoglobulin-like domain-containing protein [Thermomicrobiales bacterium]|nr:Gmad2 immunoglobulin-like domain-containing protein [Thermomicrobiales bacterium]
MEFQTGHRAIFRSAALLTGLLLAVTLLLPACGSSDDDNDSPLPTASATSAGAAPTEPASSPTGDEATSTATTAPATATPVAPSPTASTATQASPTAVANDQVTILSIFFLRDEKIATVHRTVPKTQQVAAAAMAQLLAGPTAEDAAAGMTTAIPEGTEYIGTTIAEGVATVDLSSEFESGGGSLSMSARLAQVVYTLTQFPTVDFVTFTLDGEPVTTFGGEGIVLDRPVSRKDFEDLTPIIFVASPAVNDTVSSPLRVTGTANTFEAAFMLQILDANGATLVEQPMMATSGTGTRGTFDATIEFNAPPGSKITLRVFEHSAKDGSEVNVVEIPLTVAE